MGETLRLEAVWDEAHVKSDVEALDRLWADDIAVTAQGMPVIGKKEALAVWRAGRMKFDRYDTSERRIRVYGDSAIVTGRLQRSRRMSDRAVEDNWFFTKMYVRRDGRWQVVSWHASDAPRP